MKYYKPAFSILLLLQLTIICKANDSLELKKRYFENAQQKIEDMLSGKDTVSYEKAIFLIENAYAENQMDYHYYKYLIDGHLNNIKNIISSNQSKLINNYHPDILFNAIQSTAERDTANQCLLANWAIFSYLHDSIIPVLHDKRLYKIIRESYKYSFEDPLGTIDWNNTMVSHLIRTKRGNCFALASLYKIFSDRLKSNALLCTAPGHIYITHNDEIGRPYNIELSNGSFPGSGTIGTLTYTTQDAIENDISLRQLNDRQSVALCLVYLAKGYQNKFGIKDDDFLLNCSEVALRYDEKCLNAYLLKMQVLEERILNKSPQMVKIQEDPLFPIYEKTIADIYKIGYREMPANMKEILIRGWRKDSLAITSYNALSSKLNKSGNKETRYGSLSWGIFDEEINKKPIEQYGRTLFETTSKRIIGFVDKQKLYNDYVFDPVTFAWSIDPLAHKFSWQSPYTSMDNNPVLKNDPTGAAAVPPDNYVFNEKGNYVRTEKNNQPDKLVIENSQTKKRVDYNFNDPKTDVAAIKYNIDLFGDDFKNVKFIFTLTRPRIDEMMKESGIKPTNSINRAYMALTESNGGKMDFSVYHLSTELDKAGEGRRWDVNLEIMEDKGPIFIISNQRTVYNLLDAGNWLWGNAINRTGGSYVLAKKWSTIFNSKDSDADQRAIQMGWWFQEGYQDVKDDPKNLNQ